jgi:hypothetical protein
MTKITEKQLNYIYRLKKRIFFAAKSHIGADLAPEQPERAFFAQK